MTGDEPTRSARAVVDFADPDGSIATVRRRIDALAADLPLAERTILARLLTAVRQHPFLGDEADTDEVARANLHIADQVRPSRQVARVLAGDVAARCGPGGRLPDAAIDSRAGRRLADALRDLLQSLDPTARHHAREVLSNALGGLAADGDVPPEGWQHAAWVGAIGALTAGPVVSPPWRPAGPVVSPPWRPAGPVVSPPWRLAGLDDGLLDRLVVEAGLQSFVAVRMGIRYVAPPGPVARTFGGDPQLRRLVGACVGHDVRCGNGYTTENATYLSYEHPGDGVQPHIDPFGITNALLLLEHGVAAGRPAVSDLVVYDAGGEPTVVPLRPGELVVLADGGVVHSRRPVAEGERVILLSLVYVT